MTTTASIASLVPKSVQSFTVGPILVRYLEPTEALILGEQAGGGIIAAANMEAIRRLAQSKALVVSASGVEEGIRRGYERHGRAPDAVIERAPHATRVWLRANTAFTRDILDLMARNGGLVDPGAVEHEQADWRARFYLDELARKVADQMLGDDEAIVDWSLMSPDERIERFERALRGLSPDSDPFEYGYDSAWLDEPLQERLVERVASEVRGATPETAPGGP